MNNKLESLILTLSVLGSSGFIYTQQVQTGNVLLTNLGLVSGLLGALGFFSVIMGIRRLSVKQHE